MSMHKRVTVLINKGQKRVERTQKFLILIIKKYRRFSTFLHYPVGINLIINITK